MLSASRSLCRRRQNAIALPFLLPKAVGAGKQQVPGPTVSGVRTYAQKRVARTPQSVPQRTTTNPSPTSQVKNRNVLGTTTASGVGAGAATSSTKATQAPKPVITTSGTPKPAPKTFDEKAFTKVRQADLMREMERSGSQLDMVRLSIAQGMYPWDQKAELMDLRIPQKGIQGWSENFKNNIQNVLSMYRLAEDYAFPGKATKYRLHPQIFQAKSTKDSAWIAPYRDEIWRIYLAVNKAIAIGNRGIIARFTAYEYQSHALKLLNNNHAIINKLTPAYSKRGVIPSKYFLWGMHHELTPLRIESIRAFPLYTGPQEPKYGNRNCVQVLVRVETLQSLTMRMREGGAGAIVTGAGAGEIDVGEGGRVVRPDGGIMEVEEFEKLVEEAKASGGKGLAGSGVNGKEGKWNPVKRVVEYLVFENKMFYPEGWYIRDQMYESVKPRFRDLEA